MTSPRLARLQAHNYTPASRTPWGGRKIVERFGRDAAHEGPVGESWELSLDPAQPSILADSGVRLCDAIAADREAWLGARIAAAAPMSSLQLKIIDAAEPLSLQVHPQWMDGGLAPGESGKVETWVVLHAAPGAGVFLGLREGVDKTSFANALDAGGDIAALLNFVEVKLGDVFHVAGGTPHAVGAGVMLLEPQAVQPCATPATYRFWDWERRYDAAGARDPHGAPRTLDRNRALAAIRWDAPRGDAFVAACRQRTTTRVRFSTGEVEALAKNEWFELDRVTGVGALSLPPAGSLSALLCLRGRAGIRASRAVEDDSLLLDRGHCAVAPASAGALELILYDDAELYVLRERSDWLWRLNHASSASNT